ncbi:MAG: HEAT repeat domain-containing protein [Gammaproteobacteria bacterium]|nr:HEAT repeat domain-containing protein [Gammaproteobacteria bacterium]
MKSVRLNDQQIVHYLEDGYVVLDPTELDRAFHHRMYQAACLTYGMAQGAASQGAAPHIKVIADNLRQRIPDAELLLRSPTIDGAITSVLGENWQIYPHDFIHESSANDQFFHQDGNLPWNDRGHYRSHRPDWAMLFYYPQPTDEATGPTEVLPGTQYWTNDYELPDGKWHRGDPMGRNLRSFDPRTASLQERDAYIQDVADSWGVPNLERRKLEVPCGGAILASYDLAHRGTRQESGFDGRRFMYKFYLYRAESPTKPTSQRRRGVTPCIDNSNIARIVERNWHWLGGESPDWNTRQKGISISKLLSADTDAERTRIAYELGLLANDEERTRNELISLIAHEREAIRRAAGYSFGLVDSISGKEFESLMNDERASVRRATILALREAICCDKTAIDWLTDRLEKDPDDLVRSNAAYALGILLRANPNLLENHDRLIARLDHGAEPDNTDNGGMSRSTVRENVALALTMCHLSTKEIENTLRYAIAEHDRYAKSLLFIAIQRSVRDLSDPWVADLIEYLADHRYVV